MNNWEKLCMLIKSIIDSDTSESPFHSHFVSCLKIIFNWGEESIKSKVPVTMGTDTKYADIVLTGNDFGIIIELKRPDIELGSDQPDQLISHMDNYYLNNKKCNYGLLIGRGIKFFYRDAPNNKPQLIASFGFDPANGDGVALGLILDKAVCSGEKLKEYALERIKYNQTQTGIEQLRRDLVANNGEKIKEIVKEKLLLEGYEKEAIQNILNDIIINTYTRNILDSGGKEEQTQNNNTENYDTFDEIVKYYNEKYTYKTIPADEGKTWRRIEMPGHDLKFHFEFLDERKSGIRLSLDDENENNKNGVTPFEEELRNLDGKIIVNGYTAHFNKRKTWCRLKFKIPYSQGKEFIGNCMDKFIKEYNIISHS